MNWNGEVAPQQRSLLMTLTAFLTWGGSSQDSVSPWWENEDATGRHRLASQTPLCGQQLLQLSQGWRPERCVYSGSRAQVKSPPECQENPTHMVHRCQDKTPSKKENIHAKRQLISSKRSVQIAPIKPCFPRFGSQNSWSTKTIHLTSMY